MANTCFPARTRARPDRDPLRRAATYKPPGVTRAPPVDRAEGRPGPSRARVMARALFSQCRAGVLALGLRTARSAPCRSCARGAATSIVRTLRQQRPWTWAAPGGPTVGLRRFREQESPRPPRIDWRLPSDRRRRDLKPRWGPRCRRRRRRLARAPRRRSRGWRRG